MVKENAAIEFYREELLAIGWSGAREIMKKCPVCRRETTVKCDNIVHEIPFLCGNCGEEIHIILSKKAENVREEAKSQEKPKSLLKRAEEIRMEQIKEAQIHCDCSAGW